MITDAQTQTLWEKFKAIFATETAEKLSAADSLIASLRADLAAAQTEIKTSREQFTAQGTELSTAREQLAASVAQVAALTTERDALKATIADPKGEIALRVSAIISGNSIPAGALPTSKQGDATEKTAEALVAELESIPPTDGKARAVFMEKHWDKLRAHARNLKPTA